MFTGIRTATILFLCGALGETSPLSAQDSTQGDPRTALPERPTVATHAYTVAPRYAEVEAGVQFADPRPGSALQIPTLLKIGVAHNLQFDVTTAYTRTRADSIVTQGVNDLSAGLKWHMFNDVPCLGDVALQGLMTFPTAPPRTVGTGVTGFSLLAIASHQFGTAELDANVGVTERTGNGIRTPKMATLWTASFSSPIANNFSWAAEMFGYPGTSGPAGAPSSVGVLLGPTYTARRYLVFDTGVILNVSHMAGNSGYAGLTWNLGRL